MKTVVIVAIILFVVYKMLPVIFREAGKAAGYSGNFEKALSLLEKSVKLSDKVKNKTMYGYMLMQNGRFSEAVNVFNEIAIDRGIKSADKISAKVYRIMAMDKLGRKEDAIEEAEELFAMVKNTLTYAVLGYIRQKNGDAALELCLEAYDYNDDDRDICDNLTVAYYMSGDLDAAWENAEKERERFPMFVEAFYHSALIAAKKGDKKAALEFLDEIQNCNRTMMTTVMVEEIEALKEELENA